MFDVQQNKLKKNTIEYKTDTINYQALIKIRFKNIYMIRYVHKK